MGTCPLTVKGIHSREQIPTVTAGVILADYTVCFHTAECQKSTLNSTVRKTRDGKLGLT